MIDVVAREIKMPGAFYGLIPIDQEGIYNIYINQDLSDELKT